MFQFYSKTKKINIAIDHSPKRGFSGPIKPNDKTNNANKHLGSKIPTGGRQTGCLFTIVAEELNSGLPRNNSSTVFGMGLEPAISGFQVPHHSATLSTCSQAFYTSALHESLAILIPGFLSSKGGKRERVRIEVESLALIWRVIN